MSMFLRQICNFWCSDYNLNAENAHALTITLSLLLQPKTLLSHFFVHCTVHTTCAFTFMQIHYHRLWSCAMIYWTWVFFIFRLADCKLQWKEISLLFFDARKLSIQKDKSLILQSAPVTWHAQHWSLLADECDVCFDLPSNILNTRS